MRIAVAACLILMSFQAHAEGMKFSLPESRDWSAVAFGEDGSKGVSTNELSENNARSTAYLNCNSKCEFVVPYQKGVCVAVASFTRNPHRYVNGFSRYGSEDAETVTLARCQNRGIPNCRIIFSSCG